MKGSNIIFNATKKANGVSKRVGKWSNLQEIKAKASTFDDPIQPVLKDLVKAGDIEKKPNIALWRVSSTSGAGSDNGRSRYRSPDPYNTPRGKRPSRPTSRNEETPRTRRRSDKKPSDRRRSSKKPSSRRSSNNSDALAFGAAGGISSGTSSVMYRAMM
jgi:hypothetical protein